MKRMLRKFFRWICEAEINELENEIDRTRNVYDRAYKDMIFIKNLSKELSDLAKKAVQNTQEAHFDLIKIVNLLQGIQCDVDINDKTSSWGVISLQGKSRCYLKFIDLKDKDLNEIAQFLKGYEKHNIDADPTTRLFMNKMIKCDK